MSTTQITDATREAANNENVEFLNRSDKTDGLPAGHFVQQLLNAEREKWEKEALPDLLGHPATKENIAAFEAHHKATEDVARDAIKDRDQLRQQLNEANNRTSLFELVRVALGAETQAQALEIADGLRNQLLEAQEQMDYSGVHTCSSQCQRPMCKMRRELLEHKAAIVAASNLIKQWRKNRDTHKAVRQEREARGSTEADTLIYSQEVYDVVAQELEKALTPNCGQPLMELVRGMKQRLEISTTIIGFEEDRGVEVKANQSTLTKAAQLGF